MSRYTFVGIALLIVLVWIPWSSNQCYDPIAAVRARLAEGDRHRLEAKCTRFCEIEGFDKGVPLTAMSCTCTVSLEVQMLEAH